MKNKHSLLEVGGSLLFFGLSMILFPLIFENSSTHTSNNPQDLYFEGSILVFIGLILLLIKWFKSKKNNIH